MSEAPSLNDTCRFWFALANNPDLVDDPQGLSHPLCDLAARVGMSPGHLYNACRIFKELRAETSDKSAEKSGVGSSFDFQGLQPINQLPIFVTQDGLQQSIDIDTVNAKLAGVES